MIESAGKRRRKTDLKTAPKMGTIVPNMSTTESELTVATALFGKTQRALLALFFMRPEQSFYLRQIVRTARIGQGAAQRELAHWVEAGLLVRTRRGNQVYYQANNDSPVFAELKALTVKTAGVADVLRESLAELAERITVAFVHGSMARGAEKADSDVDVIVAGKVTFSEVVAALRGAHAHIGREVNPTVYSEKEFREKLHSRHHFLTAVMAAPKLFLIGDESELKRLGA
jgi:predicted nucleotidyltransferase